MHRVVAIALAGNRIEITEMVVNPLADDPDRHTCGKNCVVFRSPNLLPRVRILRRIVVTDNRGDASLLQGRNFAGTTPCNPAARAPRTVGRAEPLRYDAFEAELASVAHSLFVSVSYKHFSFILLSPLVVARSRRTLLRRHHESKSCISDGARPAAILSTVAINRAIDSRPQLGDGDDDEGHWARYRKALRLVRKHSMHCTAVPSAEGRQ